MRSHHQFVIFGLIALFALPSLAQQGDHVHRMALALETGRAELRSYSWNQRVQISVGEDLPTVQVSQVRYDLDGQLQTTPLAATGGEKKVRGPVRKRIVKKEKGNVQDLVQRLGRLENRYLVMEPGTLDLLAAVAKVWDASSGGSRRIEGRNVVEDGDSLVVITNSESGAPQSYSITTFLDGAPVSFEFEFRTLKSGATYLARSTATTSLDGTPITVTRENFDHIRQGG